MPTIAQRTNAKLLAATATPVFCFVGDGLALLPVLLEVLSLEDEDVVDDVEDEEDDVLDDVACSLELLRVELVVELVVEFVVEFAVELVPDMVVFEMLPVLNVEFVLEPVIVELPDEPAAPVELLDFGPDEATGVRAALFEVAEAVEEGEEVVGEPLEVLEAETEARAAIALVGQVEQPPNN